MKDRRDEALRAAFERSLDGMLITNDAGVYMDANPAACAVFGRSREELMGASFRSLSIESADTLTEKWKTFLQTGQASGEWKLRRPDGEIRILQFTSLANVAPGLHLSIVRDVTAERRVQDEVRRTGELFSKVFHASPVPLVISAIPSGEFVDINDGALRLIGRTRAEVVGKTGEQLALWSVIADRAKLQAEFRETSRVRQYPARMRHKDGHAIDVVVSVETIEVRGQMCALTVVNDVTEQHRSEERYRRIVESSTQGVVTVGFDGRISFANERASALLRTDPATLVGRDFLDLVDPAMRGETTDRKRRREAGLTDTYDLTMVCPDGTRIIAEVTAAPLLDSTGTMEAALLLLTDVTERRQSDDLRARLAAIVESSRDPILSLDRDGHVKTWNAAAERLLGHTSSDVLGRNYETLVPADRVDAFRATLRQVLQGEVAATETVRLHRDGTPVDVSVTMSPIIDSAGRVTGVSKVMRDTSPHRRLQSSLREAEERLHHIQKMEAVGALAGGIAHDFNNILSVILTCSHMVEESLQPGNQRPGAGIEEARAIREAAERAATLTRQLLAFSRRQVLAPKVVDLGRVVTSLETMLRRLLGEQITLVTTSRTGVNALIDPSQLEQVILNLAVNARDAMPVGGRLTIESDHVEADEALIAGTGAKPGPYVRVRVSDTGIGMDEATRVRMFEPFFTTKQQRGGSGLGLSTVFGIIQQSGGFVRVESEPGRGTSVEVYVPRTERVPDRASSPPAAGMIPRGGETILLVEDDELVRKQVLQLLLREGYQVLSAANAGEALLISEQQPKLDLLLTDVVMPIMNGRQLSERLRVQYPDLPVMFMSGYHDDDVLRGMLGSPDVIYLQKPVRRELLLLQLRELLDRS